MYNQLTSIIGSIFPKTINLTLFSYNDDFTGLRHKQPIKVKL